jgi:transcriptional regulator
VYVPGSFAVDDRERLFALMERESFATLVSEVEGRAFATHLPLLLERAIGPCGRLVGHMAKANPQAAEADGQDVLVIFQGPHAYVSPRWYADENVVPTWNYVAVHAYGRLQAIDDPAETLRTLEDYVARYERAGEGGWKFDPATGYARRMAAAVTAFRIDLARLEGKWKLGQNHPPERRRRVIAALETQPDEHSQAIARLMAETLE